MTVRPVTAVERTPEEQTEHDEFMALFGSDTSDHLQQLREEYERTKEVALGRERFDTADWLRPQSVEQVVAFYDNEGDRAWDEEDVFLAGTRYIIARDFGEFDRDRALMLYKLQRQ